MRVSLVSVLLVCAIVGSSFQLKPVDVKDSDWTINFGGFLPSKIKDKFKGWNVVVREGFFMTRFCQTFKFQLNGEKTYGLEKPAVYSSCPDEDYKFAQEKIIASLLNERSSIQNLMELTPVGKTLHLADVDLTRTK